MSSEGISENSSWNCWIRTFLAGLGMLVVVWILGIMEAQSAVMLSQLREKDSFIHVTLEEEKWVASLGIVMTPFSALVIGPFIDAFGRKKGIQAFYLIMGLGFAVIGCARQVLHIYIGRVICSFAGGFAMCSGIYLVEICTKKQREFFFSITAAIMSSGLMVSNVISIYLQWNMAALVYSFVCFVFFFSQFFIPESPAWLFKVGQEDASVQSLKRLGRSKAEIDVEINTLKLSQNAVAEGLNNNISRIRQELTNLKLSRDLESLEGATSQICRELDSLKLRHNVNLEGLERIRLTLVTLNLSPDADLEIIEKQPGKVDTIKLSNDVDLKHLTVDSPKQPHDFGSLESAVWQIHRELDTLAFFHKANAESLTISFILAPTVWKPFLIMIAFYLLQSASGIYIIIFYTVDFFERLGTIYDPLAGSTLLCLTRFVTSTTIAIIFRSKAGRRFSTMFSAQWMAVALISAGVYECVQRDVSVTQRPLQWFPVVCLLLYTVAAVLGLLSLPWVMAGEMFPLRVRGTAAGVVNAVGFGFIFVSTQVYYSCVKVLQIWGLLFVFAGMAFVTVFFGAFILPETRGKSLYEIEQGFLPEKNRHPSGQKTTTR